MSWSKARDLHAQLRRLWDRGELLRDAVTGNARYPLRLTLRTPKSADITDQFQQVREWVAELSRAKHVRIEWREISHRVQGTQRLPESVWVDSADDAMAELAKQRDWAGFVELVESTRKSHPALLRWLERRPLQALDLVPVWPQLLAVVDWILQHPQPGIYLRQVDLPGIHSKFIEQHRAVLTEMLDLLLPADSINPGKTGLKQFADRYGFLAKPGRIRFRILDPELALLSGIDCPDITLDAGSFSKIQLAVKRVFITENETNFLAFPRVRGGIVIFGAGYGWESLSRSQWLNDCSLFYWGDIDTHGFVILDQLRVHFAHVESFLMDRETLNAHAALWGREDQPFTADLGRLTPAERALFDDLRDNRIQQGLRLEQEYVGFEWLAKSILKIVPED